MHHVSRRVHERDEVSADRSSSEVDPTSEDDVAFHAIGANEVAARWFIPVTRCGGDVYWIHGELDTRTKQLGEVHLKSHKAAVSWPGLCVGDARQSHARLVERCSPGFDAQLKPLAVENL